VQRTGVFESELADYDWGSPAVSIRAVSVSPKHYHEGAWRSDQYPKKWEGPFERTIPGVMIEHSFFTTKIPLSEVR
jgi:hypothetical protein